MRKIIAWICVILWMGVIFLFSNQPYSGVVTGHYLGSFNFPVRKAAHMTEYAILYFLLYWAWSDTIGGAHKKSMFYAFLCSFLYAISDEFHQSFIPGRSASLSDVWVDTSGSLLALLLSIWRPDKMVTKSRR